MVQYEIGTLQSNEEKVSERVVTAVADARDVDPLELPPVFESIDPDALDRLFGHGVAGDQEGPGRVTFTLAECEVVVHRDGSVDVTAPGERTPASASAESVGR